jgi:hypothetical protein
MITALYEIMLGVLEHMKDLLKKIKKAIAAGEDPELVRKLQDVVGVSDRDLDQAKEPEPIALPSEIVIPSEAFSEMRKLSADKTRLEATLGQYYLQFEKQMKEITSQIEEKSSSYLQAQKQLVADYSPDNHQSEYKLVDLGVDSSGKQKIVLQRQIEEN